MRSDAQKAALVDEARRIEEFSLWNASAHFHAATWAARIQVAGGSVPIILGAIGGWNGLKEAGNEFAAGMLALAAGIVGSLLSYWNLSRVRQDHFIAATKYKTLENEARRAYQIHALDEDPAVFRDHVLALAKRYDALGETSVQSLDIAFWLASRRIRRRVYSTDLGSAGPGSSAPAGGGTR